MYFLSQQHHNLKTQEEKELGELFLVYLILVSFISKTQLQSVQLTKLDNNILFTTIEQLVQRNSLLEIKGQQLV